MIKLKKIIEDQYPIQVESISLVRKRIGCVYKVQTKKKDYILKVYQNHQIDLVNRTVKVMHHCMKHGILVPKLYQTNDQRDFFRQEDQIGILMDAIQGHAPSKDNIEAFAKLAKALHKVFKDTPLTKIETFGKAYYIDRFKILLEDQDYDPIKSKKWLNFLDEDYLGIEQNPESFCHGDFHNENMIEDANKNLYLIDFDAANYTSSIIDIASITDRIDFNHFKLEDFLQTIQVIQDFLKYYEEDWENTLQLTHILAFIPIRHAELITTITLQTKEALSTQFLDLQYQWMLNFHQALKQVIKG
jgi:Ser/Thr protein kinase RdoA (MazF antagonist)